MKFAGLITFIVFMVSAVTVGAVTVGAVNDPEADKINDKIAEAFSEKEVTLKNDVTDESLIYVPTYTQNNTEDCIKNIYENIDEATSEMLKAPMRNFLLNGREFRGTDERKQVFTNIMDIYVDELFGGLIDLRELQLSDDEVTSYIDNESNAFDWLYSYIMGIVEDGETYNPLYDDLIKMLNCITESKCAFNTVEKYSQDTMIVEMLTDSCSYLSESSMQTINKALLDFYTAADEGSREQQTAVYCARAISISFMSID